MSPSLPKITTEGDWKKQFLFLQFIPKDGNSDFV